LGARVGTRDVPRRQMPDRRQDAEKLLPVIGLLTDLREQRFGIELEDAIVGARRNRQRGVEVLRGEGAVHVPQRDFLPLEYRAVGIAKDWQQDLVGQLLFQRTPVDVEKRRVLRAWTVLEHVLPPWVARLRDA